MVASFKQPKSNRTPNSQSIMVVGAGIIGATTALALVERGFNVTLVERAKHVASATSKANGAQLSYGYADAMASPGLIALAVRILSGQEPGMKFKLKPSLHNYSWLSKFIAQSTSQGFMRNTEASLKIALRSREQLKQWSKRYGFEFDHKVGGKIHLLPNEKSIARAGDLMALKRRYGIEQSVLSRDEMLEVEPTLRAFGGDIAGAIYTKGEEVGNPRLFAQSVVEYILSVSPKNKVIYDCDVRNIQVEYGQISGLVTSKGVLHADGYVFATGHWATQFSKALGVKLPIVPVAGYSLTYPKGPNAPQNSITDVKGKVVLCQLGDKIRIAGLADIGEDTTKVRADRLAQLKKVLTERFPGVAQIEGDGEPWIGHRPVTPDSQPIVGQTKLQNAFINCGHGTLGWTMAAACAVDVAQKICDQFGTCSELLQEDTTDYLAKSA